MKRLLSAGWLVKHSFALVIFVLLLWLGFWQLDRLAQRRAANEIRLAALAAEPLTIDGSEQEGDAPAGRRVRVTGSLLNDESIVLRNQRNEAGVNGLHLLTPLQIAGSERAILIDRGWIPGEQTRPESRPSYAITGTLTIEGVAYPGQSRPDSLLAAYDLPLPGETRIEAWIRVDIKRIQQQVSRELLPWYIEQLPESAITLPDQAGHDAATTAAPIPRDPTLLDEGPHLGYALQWFAMAGILLVGYGALLRQELIQTRLKRNHAVQ